MFVGDFLYRMALFGKVHQQGQTTRHSSLMLVMYNSIHSLHLFLYSESDTRTKGYPTQLALNNVASADTPSQVPN